MESSTKEHVYQIYKGDHHPDAKETHFLKLPHVPDQPPLYVSSKKQLPIIAQVFFGGVSLIGLYIIYRLIERSAAGKSKIMF